MVRGLVVWRPWVGKGHVASPTVCKTAAKALGVRLPPGPPRIVSRQVLTYTATPQLAVTPELKSKICRAFHREG